MELTNREHSIWRIHSANTEKIASCWGEGWRRLYQHLSGFGSRGTIFQSEAGWRWGVGGGEGIRDQTRAEHACTSGVNREQGWARPAGGTCRSAAEELSSSSSNLSPEPAVRPWNRGPGSHPGTVTNAHSGLQPSTKALCTLGWLLRFTAALHLRFSCPIRDLESD